MSFAFLPLGPLGDVLDTISEIECELLGRPSMPNPAVHQALSLIFRQVPDDRQAVTVLARALPEIDGRPHRLIRRFATKLCRWREKGGIF